ncbi:MAG: peptidase C26 [Chloroflexi bacterium]|jgi:putative glutamine amidotransferase|nr:peptidase C26 [Chloroflexota bacterium]MCS5672743.1 gamma-glutamyl-gamma-aminobutyrate hydrolase family protein [Acidimicrobiales bacterium]|tara:strand:- start:4689 stop:5414 length:726 start_codon:yes stop_codon:yes gene_type:complete
MTGRPLIGITGRRKRGDQLVGNLNILAGFAVDIFYADYGRGVLEAGGVPVFLPLDVDPVHVVGHLDGVLLTGGADIDPARYGDEPLTDEFPPEPLRDDHECAVLDAAVDRALPTVGICRGLQLINVHAGGTLHQDVPAHAGFDHPTTTEWHGVSFGSGSVLADIYGGDRRVNSLHHQTVDRLGTDLRATAFAEDASIEGLEHESLPIVAVQWHPEMLPGRPGDPLFTWLVAASATNAEGAS